MSNNYNGISFFSLLAILFIGLKLTSYVDWSWWWVLAPLWLPLAIVFVILGVAKVVVAITDIYLAHKRERRKDAGRVSDAKCKGFRKEDIKKTEKESEMICELCKHYTEYDKKLGMCYTDEFKLVKNDETCGLWERKKNDRQ